MNLSLKCNICQKLILKVKRFGILIILIELTQKIGQKILL